MNTQGQRYIFTDFDNILRVKFKRLERVCDKVFILINTSDDLIPFSLVRNLQRLGKAVKWIPVDNNKNLTLNYHICYLIGKMHTKINKDIEFAILSDDDAFDMMINYVNANNRKCKRIKVGKPIKNAYRKTIVGDQKITTQGTSEPKEKELVPLLEAQDFLLAHRETKSRLKLVATRPYNLSSLEEYIHINNQELMERGNLTVEDIIERMVDEGEIEIKNQIVTYHF